MISLDEGAKDRVAALRREYESLKGITLPPEGERLFLSVSYLKTGPSSREFIFKPKKE